MAFLSLGLQREEAQDVSEPKLQVLEKPNPKAQVNPKDEIDSKFQVSPEHIASENGDSASAESQPNLEISAPGKQNTVTAAAPTTNQTNGNSSTPKRSSDTAEGESANTEQDDWAAAGMQIIQSVLRDAQNKSSAPVSSSAETEEEETGEVERSE